MQYWFKRPLRVAVCLFGPLLMVSTISVAADLTSRMTDEEVRAAGLHKLTPAELAFLTEWLKGDQAGAAAPLPGPARKTEPAPAAPVPPSEQFGQEQIREQRREPDVPEQISARVEGEFRGWDGNTVFRLDNGQVWQQRVGGRYRSPSRQAPEVVIEKGRFGYYLKLLENGRTVGVKRIQ